MGNGSPAEPSWRQAWRDLEGFRGSAVWFWGAEVVAAAAGTLVAIWLLASPNSSNLATTFYGATGLVVGLGIAFIGMYAFYLLRAPYRQRNEARGKILEAQAEIGTLRESRPKLVVVPRNTKNAFWLEVTNLGEQGELEAQIAIQEIRSGSMNSVVRPNPYIGYWEMAASDRCSLKEGHRDQLLIGKTDLNYPFGSLQMFFFDRINRVLSSHGTTSWVWGSGEVDAQVPRPILAIRVTISASPRMPDGPFVRDYLVSGGEHDRTLSEPQTDSETNS
jgi:hypothetical protein